jgi:predicted RNA-binding protein
MGDLLGGQKEIPGTLEDVSEIKFKGHIVIKDRKGIST